MEVLLFRVPGSRTVPKLAILMSWPVHTYWGWRMRKKPQSWLQQLKIMPHLFEYSWLNYIIEFCYKWCNLVILNLNFGVTLWTDWQFIVLPTNFGLYPRQFSSLLLSFELFKEMILFHQKDVALTLVADKGLQDFGKRRFRIGCGFWSGKPIFFS